MLGVAGLLRMLDIVADHPLDPPFATLGMNQVVAEFERDHFRDVLVLRNCENFFFSQFGQFDAVLQCQHVLLSPT